MAGSSGNVCVVTGDIIRSRNLDDRAQVQARLNQALDEVSRAYGECLLARFVISLGDECQGVMESPRLSYEVTTAIQELMWPVELRFGIGVGLVSTPLSPHPAEMDGPAFHRSRRALEAAEKGKLRVVYCTGDDWLDPLLNVLAELTDTLRDGWTDRQREIVSLYRRLGNIIKVSEKAGITYQVVSKILANAHWKTVEKSERQLKDLLANLQEFHAAPVQVSPASSPARR